MAFCKHCGSEYPDGGNCTNPACPAAQQQEAAPTGNPLDGGFNEAMEHVKKNSGIIIGGVIGFIVLVILIVFLGSHTGAKGAANKYAKNFYNKNGFKKVTKVTMLNEAYKEYKDSDDFDDDKDTFKDTIEALKDNDVKVKIKSVKKGKKLGSKELKGAKAYFKSQAKEYKVDDDIEVKKGYEFKIKAKIKHDGETKTTTEKICVVKVKGNGWKVIEQSADALKAKGSMDFDLDDLDLDDFDFDDYDFDDFDF